MKRLIKETLGGIEAEFFKSRHKILYIIMFIPSFIAVLIIALIFYSTKIFFKIRGYDAQWFLKFKCFFAGHNYIWIEDHHGSPEKVCMHCNKNY